MFQAAQLPEHLNYTGTLNLNKGLHVHVHDKTFYISVSPKQKRTFKKNQYCISAESVVAKVNFWVNYPLSIFHATQILEELN